jgi:hypothetical protein
MQKLVSSCRVLGDAPEFRPVMNLRGIDVIATRLWYDRYVPTRYPANVLSGFERTAGATFFHLNQLQVGSRERQGSRCLLLGLQGLGQGHYCLVGVLELPLSAVMPSAYPRLWR